MKTVLSLLLLLAITGCMSETRWGIADTQKNLLHLEVGMTRQQVIDIMGTPTSREVIPDKNGGSTEFLFYQTRFAGDALRAPTDAELTPFAFVDGKLIGWSRNFYDNATHQEITIHDK